MERDRKRLEHLRAVYPDIHLATAAETAFEDASVDAVVIATPTNTHYALAKAALLAGKHVLVEKPITTDVAQGEELCALAEKSGRVLLVGHVFLYNVAIQRAKKYLADGELGHLYYLSLVRTNLGPIRGDVNAAWDLAAHDVSIANYWLDAIPQAVSAVGGCWINKGVDDAVFATLRYPEGVLANLHTSWLHPRKVREIAAIGDRKMMTFDDMNPQEPLRLYDRQVTEDLTPSVVDSFASFRAGIREGDVVIPRVKTGEPLKAECEEFLGCIAKSQSPLSGGRDRPGRGPRPRGPRAFHARGRPRGAGGGCMIPLVDLKAQHRQIADTLAEGFTRVFADTSLHPREGRDGVRGSVRGVFRRDALRRGRERDRRARARAARGRRRPRRRGDPPGEHVHRDGAGGRAGRGAPPSSWTAIRRVS